MSKVGSEPLLAAQLQVSILHKRAVSPGYLDGSLSVREPQIRSWNRARV